MSIHSYLVMNVYVHLMESLASGKYHPELTRLPRKVSPKLLDGLGIDLYVNKVNDSLYCFETGSGASGTKTLWVDLPLYVSDLCRLSLERFEGEGGSDAHKVLKTHPSNVLSVKNGETVVDLIDAQHYLDLGDIELDLRINGHPYSAYWRHVKDLATFGRFDPKLRLFDADLRVGRVDFGGKLFHSRELRAVEELKEDSREVFNVT